MEVIMIEEASPCECGRWGCTGWRVGPVSENLHIMKKFLPSV